jgi:hypothetical protein
MAFLAKERDERLMPKNSNMKAIRVGSAGSGRFRGEQQSLSTRMSNGEQLGAREAQLRTMREARYAERPIVNWLLATLEGYRYSDRKERCCAPVRLAAFSRLASRKHSRQETRPRRQSPVSLPRSTADGHRHRWNSVH